MVALTWGNYRLDKPLGRLSVHRSFNAKAKEFRPTKSEVPQQVPVHLVLAEMLDDWKAHWSKLYGRSPTPADLIMPWVPKRGPMEPWRTDTIWKRLQRDLTDLRLRQRRVHDFRRSFISLCRQDGARDDLLKWVTHGRPPGIMDVYTTPPWPALCAQVEVLNIAPPRTDGPDDEPPKQPEDASRAADGDLQPCLHPSLQLLEDPEIAQENEWSRRESNTPTSAPLVAVERPLGPDFSDEDAVESHLEPLSALVVRRVEESLRDVLKRLDRGDIKGARDAIRELLE